MRRILLYIIMYGASLAATAQTRESHNAEIARNLETFADIYRQLDMFYVDTLSADTTIEWAIRAMLNRVDPYTDYYPRTDESLQQMTTGKYAGIGSVISYHQQERRAQVTEPYEGTPSQLAGLRAGDIILTVDGTDVEGMPIADVTKRLRGDAGTTVEVRVKRYNHPEPLTFKITRKTIQFPDVPYYDLQQDSVGYILLSGFTQGAAMEMRRAVTDLKQQGMKSLILDLRDNPGGSIDEAIAIVNLFVPKGVKVVSTKGKVKSTNRDYYTTQEPVDQETPIVALVNSGSASAAEIVSGSLQDMDRAVILGTRTYGKGLVQSVRELNDGGELKMTISRYHIPSGRCIQAYDYRHLNPDGSVGTVPDSLTRVFHTRGGREVRDGGGIQPDLEVRPDSFPSFLYDLVGSQQMIDYCTRYAARHPHIAPAGEFCVTEEDYAGFVQFMQQSGFQANRRSEKVLSLLRDAARLEGYLADAEAEFEALAAKLQGDLGQDLQHMKPRVTALLNEEIVQRYYYHRGLYRQQLLDDNVYAEALRLLADPERYKAILKQ